MKRLANGDPDTRFEAHNEYEEELFECELCGGRELEEDINNGVCDRCLEKEISFIKAVEYGANRKEQVELNGFLFSQFTDREIEEILIEELKKYGEVFPLKLRKGIEEYCLDDKWDFAEFIKDKGV